MKRNRFSKALHHLKSTELDEKIQRLNEAPTNRTDGVYSLNPPGFRLGTKDPQKIFYPDIYGNWPAGIPGIPGELSYTRPEGYWSGESDWDSINLTDFSQDYLLTDPTGTSTDRLISANGIVLSQLPPGGQGFILGPLVDGFVPNHTYDAYTNIGYLQKDTRQFVLLARIQGQWKSNLNGNYSVWDGSSGQLTIYNQNFTLAMTEWFRDLIVANNFTNNVPYFYSGGVPQIPQSAANCPNCPPGMYGGRGPGGNSYGSGGNPNVGNQQGNSNHGNSNAAGYPWGQKGPKPTRPKPTRPKPTSPKPTRPKPTSPKPTSPKPTSPKPTRPKPTSPKPTSPKPTSPKPTSPKPTSPKPTSPKPTSPKPTSPKIVGPKIVGPKIVGPKIVGPKTNKKDTVVDKLFNEIERGFKILGSGGNAVDAKSYNAQLASSLFFSIISGKSLPITLDIIAKSDMIKNVNLNNFAKSLEIGKAPTPTSYNATNPGNKKNVLTGEWGSQGGSEVHYNPKTDTLTITSNKMLRTGEPGDEFNMSRQTSFGDIPPPNPKVVQQKVTQLLTHPAIDSFLSGLGYTTNISTGQIKAVYPTNLNQINSNQQVKNPWDLIKNDSDALKDFTKSLSSAATDIATGAVQGTASNAVAIRQVLTNLGVPQSDAENIGGGYGHVYSQTSYNGKEIPQNLRNIISNKVGVKESLILENRTRILREIKKPYILPEQPKQKLTNYKPNFAGKYTSQNTPDITSSKESDKMVQSQNSAGQAWRTKDKYWKGYETTERMNIVYDNLGHGSQYWDTIINENQRKTGTGWKDYEIQDHLNKIAHEKAMLKENPNFKSPFRVNIEEQETMQAEKDPLFKRVSKRLKKEIDYSDKPSKNGYPNDPPPEMINGMHPDLVDGKQIANRFNRLDPQSAEAMPLTGNPEIDKKVKKARKQPK